MNREKLRTQGYILHGVLFLYLLFNAVTKPSNDYKNLILLVIFIGYMSIAVLHHLSRNKKI